VLAASSNVGFLDYNLHKGLLVYPMLATYQQRYFKSYPLAIFESSVGESKAGDRLILSTSGVEEFALAGRRIESFADGTILLRPYARKKEFGYNYFPTISFSQLLQGEFADDFFADAIVLLDVTASGFSPVYNLDQERILNRVELHATAVANLVDNTYIRRTKGVPWLEFILMLGFIFMSTVAIRTLSPLQSILFVALVLPAALLGIALFTLVQFKLWLFIAATGLATLLNGAGQFYYKNYVEEKRRRMVERALTGYTSKAVMAKLSQEGESFLTMAGERRDLTVLFFDIKGFTQLSQRLTPEEIFSLLNRIFEITDAVIIDEMNGMIDKKMGDACLALFGLDGNANHPEQAVRTALRIQEVLFERWAELQRFAHKESLSPGVIQLRVGVSTGTVCLGNVGSQNHYNFTAVGDVVNLAQRLEAACTPGEVLISEETYTRTKDQIEAESKHAGGKREEEFYLAYRVLGFKKSTPTNQSQIPGWPL
jgi:adenylate cyclase